MRFLGLEVSRRRATRESVADISDGLSMATSDWFGRSARSGFDKLPAVYGCVRLLAQRLAGLPRRVINDNGDVLPTPEWITTPNGYLSGGELIVGLVWSLLLDGSAFVVPVRRQPATMTAYPEVTGLVLPHPRQVGVSSMRDADGRETVAYTLMGRPWYSELLHAKFLAIPGRLRGVGPIGAAQTVIAAGEASQDFVRDQFARAATVSYALIAKDSLEAADKRALAAQVMAQHHGARNSYIPLVLDGEIGIEKLSIEPKQAQFLELSTWTAATICGQLFGVDPTLLGIAVGGSSLTYSNALDRDRNLWTDALAPLARIIEDLLSGLLPPGQRFDFDERGLLLGGPRDRGAIAEQMARINAANGTTFGNDEIRDALGYAPDADVIGSGE